MQGKLPPKMLGSRKQRVSWYSYDFASSGFANIILTFVFPAYFTEAIAPDKITGTQLWGYTIAIAGLIIALISPILGAIADYNGRRKAWLFIVTYVLIITTACLWFSYPTPEAILRTLILIAICNIAYEISFIFYNALLPTAADHVSSSLGRVSGWGWAIGNMGGLAALVISLLVVLSKPTWLNVATFAHTRFTTLFVAVWFIVFSIPIFLFFIDKPRYQYPLGQATRLGLKELKETLRSIKKTPNLFIFLLARMIYTDGMVTLAAFGGIYAAGTFNFSPLELLMLGIGLNITTAIGAVIFGWMDDLLGAKPTLLLALSIMTVELIIVILTQSLILFWIIALAFGFSFGPVMAASRSLMVRVSPPGKIAQMFGLYAVSGRLTTFLGPLLFGEVTAVFATQRAGMAIILLFVVVGGAMMFFVKEKMDRLAQPK